MLVVCDFETLSMLDLKTAGAWAYAEHFTTEIISLDFTLDDGPHELWTPVTWERRGLYPQTVKVDHRLFDLAANPSVKFVSHASFEQAIWHHIMVGVWGFAPIPIERWIDTQAACALHAIPIDLDGALRVMALPVTKDLVGRRATLALSRLNKKTGMVPQATRSDLEKVHAYNRVDVDGTVLLHRAFGDVEGRERQVWELDQRINQRGIGVDYDFVRGARRIVAAARDPLIAQFKSLTGVAPGQVAAVRGWLEGQGMVLPNLQADMIDEAIAEPERYPEATEDAWQALKWRALTSSASVKKLDAMAACTNADGRARGLLQYHRAGTGRWAGRIIQPQNLPRPTVELPKDAEEVAAAISIGEVGAVQQWGEPIEVVSSALRHAFVGNSFGAGDFAGVEARMVLALAGQKDKCDLLASGADVYRDVAADIFGLNKAKFLAIPKDGLTVEQAEQRAIGKNTILGCGFQMGWKTFRARYCPKQTPEFAKRVVEAYRKTWAPNVPKLWADLEHTALCAVYAPGNVYTTDCGIKYKMVEFGGVPFLACRLLNGKKIYYCRPKRIKKAMPWDETDVRDAWTYQAQKLGAWKEIDAYGGLLTENVVQALARELLVEAMFRFEEAGFPIVLTVHDEVVVERPDITEEIVREIMTENQPQWAIDIGMPVAVEEWVSTRYRK